MKGPNAIPNTNTTTYPQLAHHPVGQRIANLYQRRISQFSSSGQYEKQNLLAYVFYDVAYISWNVVADSVG